MELVVLIIRLFLPAKSFMTNVNYGVLMKHYLRLKNLLFYRKQLKLFLKDGLYRNILDIIYIIITVRLSHKNPMFCQQFGHTNLLGKRKTKCEICWSNHMWIDFPQNGFVGWWPYCRNVKHSMPSHLALRSMPSKTFLIIQCSQSKKGLIFCTLIMSTPNLNQKTQPILYFRSQIYMIDYGILCCQRRKSSDSHTTYT